MKIKKQLFGKINEKNVIKYSIENKHGFKVSCLNYGCIVTEIIAPDRGGKLENVVLGFDNLENYVGKSPYFGAIVGRFAGRIKNAEFEIDGKHYTVAKNDNVHNHLHGGKVGLSHVIWDTKILESGLEFTYFSPDGEEGYPGNLRITVTYTISNENELHIAYFATTDQKTLLNMTNHSYFNLSGNLKMDILDHTLVLDSDKFVELKEDLLPTGTFLNVEGTPFDFRNGRKIKDGKQSEHQQNKIAGDGYDHPFILNKQKENEIMLSDEKSGRVLTIETDEPAVILYTSNQMGTDLILQGGIQSKQYLGLCLETQGLPDSVHHHHFPTKILAKNQNYISKTKYKFGICNDRSGLANGYN
jgi:aldose 1-epimerase